MSASSSSSSKGRPSKPSPVSIQNRRAWHEYHVLQTLQVGIVLTGTEIKSIRAGKASIIDSFARIESGQVWLYGMQITPYDHATHFNHDPNRVRKLLLNRAEIKKLDQKLKQSGLTLIPLKVYMARCWVKIELGLCQGKKLYDKRQTLAEREGKRNIERATKQYKPS